MMFPSKQRNAASTGSRSGIKAMVCVAAVAAMVTGCRSFDDGTRVAGWSIADPAQRHPIMVSQQPTSMSIRVARGSYGMSPHQRAQVVSFLEKYRSIDSQNSRLVVEVPSGSPNEVAAMQAVSEIRSLIGELGFKQSDVNIEAVPAGGDAQAPIRIAYLRYVAEGPQCGAWPSNLAMTYDNNNYHNMGCATQANFAAMVANPADLVTPRASTPRNAERDYTVWEKYIKGESTISTKQGEEKVQTKGSN